MGECLRLPGASRVAAMATCTGPVAVAGMELAAGSVAGAEVGFSRRCVGRGGHEDSCGFIC